MLWIGDYWDQPGQIQLIHNRCYGQRASSTMNRRLVEPAWNQISFWRLRKRIIHQIDVARMGTLSASVIKWSGNHLFSLNCQKFIEKWPITNGALNSEKVRRRISSIAHEYWCAMTIMSACCTFQDSWGPSLQCLTLFWKSS